MRAELWMVMTEDGVSIEIGSKRIGAVSMNPFLAAFEEPALVKKSHQALPVLLLKLKGLTHSHSCFPT